MAAWRACLVQHTFSCTADMVVALYDTLQHLNTPADQDRQP